MDFVSIDFETANSSRASACSIGLCYVEDGQIVKTEHRLIRPEPLRFNYFNTLIHGITENDVIAAPSFADVWGEIAPTINGKLIVCHNAAFDMSVVRHCLDAVCCAYPEVDYICTMCLAQAANPNEGCYRLDYLCLKYSIELLHHYAASDAEACAKLFLKLCETLNVSSIDALQKKEVITFGRLYSDGYIPCSRIATYKQPQQPNDNKEIEILCLDENIVGKTFVFTGALSSMSRDMASKIVIQGGGIVKNDITKQTNYLVSGIQSHLTAIRGNGMSGKYKKALLYAEDGQDIQIIKEDDFIKLIGDELWSRFFQTI